MKIRHIHTDGTDCNTGMEKASLSRCGWVVWVCPRCKLEIEVYTEEAPSPL